MHNFIIIISFLIGLVLIWLGITNIFKKKLKVVGKITDVDMVSMFLQTKQTVKTYPIKVTYSYEGKEKIHSEPYSSVIPPVVGQSIDVYINETNPIKVSLINDNKMVGTISLLIGLIICFIVGCIAYGNYYN